jgi:hypothetical protein
MAALDRNYDSPEYNITRDAQFNAPILASSVYVARFFARARCYVTNIIVNLTSVASVAALTADVGHGSHAAAAYSATAVSTAWLSAPSAGSTKTIALNRTLAAGEKLGLLFNDAKGKVHVTYEYQILPT